MKVDVIYAKTVVGQNANNNTKLMQGDLIMDKKEKTFICAICGKGYDSILDRATCEIDCTKKKEEEEKRVAAAKKMAEKNMRKEAVDEAVANAFRLVKSYMNDYGSYSYDGETTQDFVWPSKIWHYFG